ncbi:signal recognition particle-docking protein FtsY [archaeon]|nr:MAG: signal recognition particle-docking protein FtsY [archaeon]RLG65104.1 MAG: signal recognition particle-docking protein FtsY [archaeon]HDM24009.1 signal recognition particle-docking protein FtsY [Candidatus Bathyarchaeota archaeon]
MFKGLRQAFSSFKENISSRTLSEEELNRYLQQLSIELISNNVAVETCDAILSNIRDQLLGSKVKRFLNVEEYLRSLVKDAIIGILKEDISYPRIESLISEKLKSSPGEPFIILFLGVNGVGKTTTIAKLANYLRKRGYKVLLSCSDTFRAGAIEQLSIHAQRLNIPIIKGEYGADPASVAFNAIEHAKARGFNVVLIDTAGRMHTDRNLLEEMKKIKRVAKPDLTVLVLDALTGNDAIYQADIFDKEVGFDAFIVAKCDADDKGGILISLIYTFKKPILFIGIGQSYDDIEVFTPDHFVKKILEE